jgi:hypothetical protein
LSVIVEIVCRDTSAPYTSARCAAICPVVNPLADNEITMSSTPVNRRSRLRTICGFGQLLQQTPLAGQLQAGSAGLLHQLGDELGVDPLHVRLGRLPLRHRASISLSAQHISHQVRVVWRGTTRVPARATV